ncbi:TPA: VRR-NUC domain-containing protein [Citrobacter freundii]|nr:VRR-NUC domain-containing protein [Citrobacter freundii]HCD1267988.1 VRR-NUC domain-containing protein [Citrobacter freundii]
MTKANPFNVNWLEDYKSKRLQQGNSKAPKKAAKRHSLADLTQQYESPHFKALNYLAAHPDDLKGKQEHYAQVRIFWHFERTRPEIYKRLHSTPNGGLRADSTAARMKAEGQKKGYPDLSYDKPRGIYCGLRLELKYGKNSVSAEQKEWLNQLADDGYYCVVCYGEQEAIDAITAYDALEDFGEMPPHIHDAKWKKKAA